MTEDEMVRWHHQLNGHESEQTLGDGDGKGSLACCIPQGHKELGLTEQLKNSQVDRVRTELTALWYWKDTHQYR